MGYIIFDGVKSTDFGITVDGASAFNAPERDIETFSIAGRNGDLIVDNKRYKNIPVSYPSGITHEFKTNAERARAFFLARSSNYYRLTDSYDTEHFRLGRYSGGMEFTPTVLSRSGKMQLTFDCKPQRFLVSGEMAQVCTNGEIISNLTAFDAAPIISIIGAMAGAELHVNGRTIGIVEDVSRASIDCDLMECFNGASNLNNSIQCDNFPVLSPGNNVITWSGEISTVSLIPRWWIL